MVPVSQTLFSLTLFLALSSLLAWSNRRNRSSRIVAAPVAANLVRSDDSVRIL